ncbi:MAG: hypothetical protein AAF547_15840 [Actinomycetota bacterium]
MKNPSAAEDSGADRTGTAAPGRSDGVVRSSADDCQSLDEGVAMLNDVDALFGDLQSSLGRLTMPGR